MLLCGTITILWPLYEKKKFRVKIPPGGISQCFNINIPHVFIPESEFLSSWSHIIGPWTKSNSILFKNFGG